MSNETEWSSLTPLQALERIEQIGEALKENRVYAVARLLGVNEEIAGDLPLPALIDILKVRQADLYARAWGTR